MRTLLSLVMATALVPSAAAQTLRVGGFDESRTFRPLTASQATLGYAGVVAELSDPNNFGPNGLVGCSVSISLANETPLVDAAYLASIDVFFTGVIDTVVSAAELSALAAWQASGGHVIVLADSASSSNAPANDVVAALGGSTTFLSSSCPNDANGATFTGAHATTNGPFGNLVGSTFAMSLAAEVIPDATVQTLLTCTDGTFAWAVYPQGTLGGAGGGMVLCGGDTSWIDLFTLSSGSLYNPSNMPFALNTFAAMCGGGSGSLSLQCDPANAHSGGAYVTLASSTTAGPGPLHLEATDGPPGEFGYFLVSLAFTSPGQSISNGMLCLTLPIARYAPATAGAENNSLGQFDAGGVMQNIAGTSAAGSGFDVPANVPSPVGGTIQPGTTHYFQCWYRDGNRSNFSNVLQYQ